MSELKQPEQKKTAWRSYIPAMVLMYMDIQKADKNEIEKFGDAYRDYMDRVPPNQLYSRNYSKAPKSEKKPLTRTSLWTMQSNKS